MTQYITAFEYESIPIDESASTSGLTPSEADYLAFLGELQPGFCARGYRSVTLAQYCGVVSLGDRILEILPKVNEARSAEESRGLLLRLLAEAESFRIFPHLSVGQSLRHARLLDIFIAAFFDAVANVVRGGLLRQYREREEDIRVVRGRIVTSRQFGVHANRPDRVACCFDDVTADNTWNRLVKAALRAVRPWIASVDLHRRWVELMVVFDEVDGDRIDASSLTRLVFDRHAIRYRTVIDWVRWILSLLSPALRAGKSASPGLLFDMNILFQSAVASVLRRSIDSNSNVHLRAQETGRHLATIAGNVGRREIELKPDLILRRGDRIIAVGDTKWKRLEVSKSGYLIPATGDIYQMHAYATGFGCDNVALIYPWHSELETSKETVLELPKLNSRKPIVSVICIDLNSGHFNAVRGQSTSEFGRLFSDPAHETIRKAS